MDRLNKYLAHAGVGSRRHCDELILAGRVSVDGHTVRELGTRVVPGQRVAVDGEPVRGERPVYWLVHKPRGYLCTNHDPARRPLAIDLVPHVDQRVYTVGRLDLESEGLLLLTNDGELANRLMHPKYGVEKEYLAEVEGRPTPRDASRLRMGVNLSDGPAKAMRASVVAGARGKGAIKVLMGEGRKREVRRMLAEIGLPVVRLVRLRVGPIRLREMPAGTVRELTPEEVRELYEAAGL